MRSGNFSLLWIVCGVLAAGCASKNAGDIRLAPTGIEAGDAVAFLLQSYKETGTGDEGAEQSNAIEQSLFACLGNELAIAAPELHLVSPQSLRDSALQGREADTFPVATDAVLELLADQRELHGESLPRLRYVVLLEASVWESKGKPAVGVTDKGWGVERNWDRGVRYGAKVLDIAHRRVAGRLWGESSGKRGTGVAFVAFILPVPYAYWAQPDSNACTALGQALARFLAN